ncbi:MAG: hypothetical protein M1834_006198 [Cirrosporium novae-zelandiae]|nr:MAG: hypothetical protein M1834_006198 [Cirrosporium novae-zelandiae]
MTTPKPTLVFVHGAWHGPDCFQTVVDSLKACGYPTKSLTLPSSGAEPPLKSTEKDIKVIRDAIEESINNGEDVVVIVHSYGGIPSSDACKGLGKTEKKPGVVRLVYVSAFLLPEGVCLLDAMGGTPLPWLDIQGDYAYVKTPEKIFYNDLDEPTTRKWVSRLQHHSAAVFLSKVGYAAWKDLPTTYLLCENDATIPLPVQEQMVAAGNFTVERCSAGHMASLSQPKRVVETIRRSCGEQI